MKPFHRFTIVCACVLTVLVAGGASVLESSQPSLTKSHLLKQLDPESLTTYLEVGESLGAIAESDADTLLASQSLVIGIGLAVRDNQSQLAASMCIALASIETDSTMAETLWDLAIAIDPDRYQAWVLHRDDRAQEVSRINRDAARALYAARFANPKLATELPAQIANLDPERVNNTMNQMISDATDDDCRGRIFIPKRGDDGQMRRIVCQDHARPVGVALGDESLRWFIKLELILLEQLPSIADSQDWEVVTYLKLDAPARDPSTAMIVQHYRVDLSKPYRKGARWAATQ